MKGASKSSLDYLGPRIVSSLQNIASQDTSAAAVLVQQITQKPTKAIKLGSLQLIKNYFFEQKLHYSPACNLFKSCILHLQRSRTPVSVSSCPPSSSLSASSVLSLVSWESKLSQNIGLFLCPGFPNIEFHHHAKFSKNRVFLVTNSIFTIIIYAILPKNSTMFDLSHISYNKCFLQYLQLQYYFDITLISP